MRRIRKLGAFGAAAALILSVVAVLLEAPAAVAATLTWTVDDLGDAGDAAAGNGTCATAGGQCTLRAAIQEANTHPADTNRIHFGIAGTIQAGSLPTMTSAGTVVDGTTAPGYAGTPVVTVRGTSITPGSQGLSVAAADVTIQGLRLGNWGRAIRVDAAGTGVRIEGNQIGSAGGAFDANLAVSIGVTLNGADGVVGGPTAAQRNVIAGFLAKGVVVTTGDGSVVEGNRIGTNAAGTASAKHPSGTALITFDGEETPNIGVDVGADDVTIRGNQIAGNAGYGVAVRSGGFATVVANLVGTTADGASPLGNTGYGIVVQQAGSDAQIGGTGVADGNVVAATALVTGGVYKAGAGIGVDQAAHATIQGNLIGTNAAGATTLDNGGDGVVVSSNGSDALIGGTAAGAGNVIHANNRTGVLVSDVLGSEEVRATIQGNRIGTNPAGTAKLGPMQQGITIGCGTKVVVGGSAAGAGNLISGMTTYGIQVCDAKRGSVIQGNRIGTDATGTTAITNSVGVLVQDPATAVTLGPTKVLIGGSAAGAGNLLSGNDDYALDLDGPADVQGNLIGTNAAGTAVLPIPTSSSTTVAPGARPAGPRAVPGGSSIGYGIYAHSVGVSIGGAAPGAGNVISGHPGYGIYLNAATAAVIKGNKIGTNAAGTGAIANSTAILIGDSDGTVIGGVGAGEGNTIAFNTFEGINLGSTANDVTMRGNRIHSNGRLPVELNYFHYSAGHGANGDQVPPIMTATIGAQTAVTGTLTSDTAGMVPIDVYASDTCAAEGSGESKQYLGTITLNHPGGGVAQPFSGNVPAPSPGNTVVTAMATVPGNGTSQFSVCEPVSDLQVTAVTNADKAPVGDEVATLVTIANRGPTAAPGVVAELIAGVGPTSAADEYVADVPSHGSVDHDTNTWTIGTLPSGASATVCLRAPIARATYPWPGLPGLELPAILGLGARSFYDHDPFTGNDQFDDVIEVGPRSGGTPGVCALPTVSVGDAQVTRPASGTANMTFTVSLSKGQGRDVSVKYATQNGTAASVIDYVATSGTLTIPAGQVSKTFTVPIVGNQSDEPDKQFTVVLSEPTKATIADGSGTGTIKANGALAGCPPGATKNQAFVCHLYFDALNRAAETGGFNYWVNRLNNGDPRANMAKTYMAQPESRRVLVNRIFIFYLGRNGTADELKSWADKLAAKTTTPEKIRISLLASNSYYSKAGSTAEKWVVSVYRDVFRRDPDAGGKQFWLNKLNAGQTRTQVATGMLTTDEGRRRVIDDIFLRFVRRFPPQSESTPWVTQIKAGKTEIDIMVAVIASTEYYNRP